MSDENKLDVESNVTKVSEAFSKAWAEIETPKHNKKVTVRMKNGGSYQFEYTDLTGIYDAIKPSFSKNGLSVTQDLKTIIDNGKTYLSVTTKIIHSSGEYLESSPIIVLVNSNMQDMGGQATYLKRYSLSAILGISTEQDDDGNASVGNQATFNNKPKPTPKKISASQKSEIEKKSKEFAELRNQTVGKVIEALNISDLNLITASYAEKSIATLDSWLKKANEDNDVQSST